MIYANTSWWLNQLGGGGWLDDDMYAWVAHYGRAKGEPGFTSGKTVMHQFTDKMAVRGYAGLVDGNYCWADLALLTQGGGVVAPPVIDPRPDGWWTVDRGQTLSGIGVAVGIDWRTLAEWNDLANPNLLSVGQRLRLTAPDAGSGGGNGGTHTVAVGDTLSGIAAQHGLTWQELYAANRGVISDPDRIQPGWVLLVPAAGSEPAPPSSDHLYVVQPGDNLSAIGARLGVSWQWLAETNGITNPDLIYTDQQLRY
jgi:nucleoid-associated protein YgaU